MGVDGVDASVPDQTDQVEGAARAFEMGAKVQERPKPEEGAGSDAVRDSNQILHHDPARAEVQVADFAVPHLAVGEADRRAARLEERLRRAVPEPVPDGGPAQLDRVMRRLGSVAPAVQNDQRDRGLVV